MVGLLDVNVLVALLVPEHQHHNLAAEWFGQEAVRHGWATCAVTELGVIRVCAQLPGGPWPPETIADRLLLLAARGDYEFWPDAVPPSTLAEVREAQSAKQITDLVSSNQRDRSARPLLQIGSASILYSYEWADDMSRHPE